MCVIILAILLAVNIEVGLSVSRLTQPRMLKDSNLPESIPLVQFVGILSEEDAQPLHLEEQPEVTFVRNVDLADSEEQTDFLFLNKLLRRPQLITKSEIPKEVKSLYYAETDANDREIYSKWLYNLRDVAELLKEKFGVDIAM